MCLYEVDIRRAALLRPLFEMGEVPSTSPTLVATGTAVRT
jgi:hypothetical protein